MHFATPISQGSDLGQWFYGTTGVLPQAPRCAIHSEWDGVSSLFSRQRVVVPLVRSTAIGKISFAGFSPTFKIRGVAVVLHPLEIVSVPMDQLGEVVGSLSDKSQMIVAALEELLTRDWK
jgi:toxin CcdB